MWPRIPCPTHLHEVVPLQLVSIVQRELETKLLGLQLPLQWSKSPCATYNGNSIPLRDHDTRHTTSSVCQKKRKENADWFSWRTNSKSLDYTSC